MSGLPNSGSQNLGAARATITMDLSDLLRAQSQSQQIGKQIAQNLNQVNTSAKNAQQGAASLTSTLRQLGIGFSALQIGRFALEADTVATAYKRQTVAAISLAGSQGKLNELLATYDRVTGGAIDKASQMADVTKLQAIGFADTAAELDRFTTAARGISVATGRDQDYVISQLQLEMVNQRGMRLDQIGMNKPEVAARVRELKEANHGLTQEMAYQQAVLDVAIGKFGKLVTSQEAQATGQEKAARAWKDFRLELGIALGPATASAMLVLVDDLQHVRDALQGVQDGAKAAGDAIKAMGGGSVGGGKEAPSGIMGGLKAIGDWDPSEAMNKWIKDKFEEIFSTSAQGQVRGTTDYRNSLLERRQQMVDTGATKEELANLDAELKRVNSDLAGFSTQLHSVPLHGMQAGFGAPSAGKAAPLDPNIEARENDIIEWSQSVKKIEASANADRLAATTQYESQRSETIRNYEQGIAREAQDFAISRRRAAEQLADTITQIGVDSARQAAKWAENLADSIAQMQEDSGKRSADAQEAAGKRLAEINDQYAKNRERAARDHGDKLMDAAANLDARAVFNEQKAYARSSQDASDAHDKALSDTNEQLKERTEKEAENLAERIQQAQEANAKQLRDAKEADELRIVDAKDALTKSQQQEDEDRALRLARQAEDQANQLAQQAEAQAQRLAQIEAHAKEERAQLDEEFQTQLDKDGLRNDRWVAQQEALKALALKQFDDWWKHVIGSFGKMNGPISQADKDQFIDPAKIKPYASGGPIARTGPIFAHAGEYMLNKAAVDRLGGFSGARQVAMTGGRSNTLNLGAGSIVVNAAAGQDAYAIAYAVRKELLSVLENELN